MVRTNSVVHTVYNNCCNALVNCGNNTSSIAYYVLLCYVEGNSLQLILMQHHNTFHYKSVLIKL